MRITLFDREPKSLIPLLCLTVSAATYDSVREWKYWLITRTTEIRVGRSGQRLWLFRRLWIERIYPERTAPQKILIDRQLEELRTARLERTGGEAIEPICLH